MKNWIWITVTIFLPQTAFSADVPAILNWSHRVEMTVPVSGVVKAVNVDVGDKVRKGQVLLALDSAVLQAKVAESQARINRLTAEVAETKRDFDRVQELHSRTVVATAELDMAKLKLIRTETLLAEERAGLRQQQKALDDSSLRAPFDAVVVSRQAEPGTSVAAGLQSQTLLVLAQSGEMIARLQLSVAQIDKLKVGQAATVVAGGQSYPGKIKSLGLEPVKIKDETSYQVDVVFFIKEQLRAGAEAMVKLP